MGWRAVQRLEKAGHEVVLEHMAADDLLAGALEAFDAIIIRSATKLPAEVLGPLHRPLVTVVQVSVLTTSTW